MKFVLVALSWYYAVTLADPTKDPSNYCLDALNHKKAPGPEAELHGECTPWKDRSCCTTNTTKNVDMMNSYNFNFDHCSHIHPMSSKCQTHFKRDMCFYECEPNLGPWIVPVKMKTRKERFYKVPLCASECNQWFEDCKSDYTCAKNWIKDFKWNGTNQCVQNCSTFEETYGTAADFCQLIWDDSWVYTADDKPCMKIWFNSTNGNPNDAVFQDKMQSSEAASVSFLNVCYVVLIFVFLCGSIVALVLVKRTRDRRKRGLLFY